MIFRFFLIISLILFTKSIITALKENCNNSISFYIISIIVLSSGLCLLWFYYNSITFSLIISLANMITIYLFILELKTNYHTNTKYMIPYFIISIFSFSYIINQFLLLAHQ